MRTVFISGVDKGLGRAFAERFLGNGDFVIGTSITGAVDYTHKNLTILPLDFLKPDTINYCIQEIKNLNKPIDILINNAGILIDRDDEIPDLKKIRTTLEVNLFGHIQITEGLISHINSNGHIINVSSSAGSLENTTQAHYPAYKMSKAALNMYTRTLAVRLRGQIIVSSFHPGWTKTDMGGLDADLTPEEVADDMFDFVNSKPETGQFWFKGQKFPW